MAYTSPRTWVVGEVVTASIMNSAVRDNLLFIATIGGLLVHEAGGLETDISGVADGGIMRGTGAGVWAILADFLDTNGRVKHEKGGIEADISAIVKGGLLSGIGTGSMGILAVGVDDLVLTANAAVAGGVKWAYPPTTLVRKTSDESLTNDNTLQNDDTLLFAVGANEVWVFSFVIKVLGAGTTADIKATVVGPSGATVIHTVNGPSTSLTNTQIFNPQNSQGRNTGRPKATSTDWYLLDIHGIIVNGGTGGNLQLQWAQNTSSADFTRVEANSYLVAHKFA